MEGKRNLLIIGGAGCAIVLAVIFLFPVLISGYVFYFFYSYGDAPSVIDEPDLWYHIPGEVYVSWSRDCPTSWESVGGLGNHAQYCETLANPPSIADGMPTGVIVSYEGPLRLRVKSVELIISPYDPAPPADSENEHIDGFVFAATVEENIELDDCTPTYVGLFNSGAWSCDDLTYVYSGRISIEPNVQNKMRFWIAQRPEDVQPKLVKVATEEHRRVAELSMRRAADMLKKADYVEAEYHYGAAYFVMERLQSLETTNAGDAQLMTQIQEARSEITGQAREVRLKDNIPVYPPRYYGLFHLPALLGHDFESLKELLRTGARRCEYDETMTLTHCTFTDEVTWEVVVDFENGYSEVAIVAFPDFDLPFSKEALHHMNLPVVPPDHEEENLLRWNYDNENVYVEFRQPEEVDFIVFEIGYQ